jgi:hypothetical protein
MLLVGLFLGPLSGVPATGQGSGPVLELELVVDGLAMPLGLTHAGDGRGRLFLLLQGGQVLIHLDGALLPRPFLDLSSRISCCGERGLLGLAFHPRYERNGRLFVNYTDRSGATVVAELRVSADPDVVDAGSEREILRFSQPFSNHNGGHIAFGPDGYLYIASGDGGSGGDPQNNGQALDTLLGKLLRIDVDGAEPFAVPDDNPFASAEGDDEIWAFGLRNPWRFSFDRQTGDLFIGDVGQNAIEEIDFQPAASSGGENYGWRLMEGAQCFEPQSGCNDGGLRLPILQYNHSLGCSVTAGYRYRGPEEHTLPRYYVFGDFCSGRIWGGRSDRAGNWRMRQLLRSGLSISSFGEDQAGNVYVIDYGGGVYLMRGLPLFASDFESGNVDDWSSSRGGLTVVSPGLEKSEGALEVPVDGSATRRFLRSDEPNGEAILEASFRLSANRVDLDGGEVEILRLEGSSDPVSLSLEQEGRKYFVRLYVLEGGGEPRFVGRVKVPKRRAVLIGVDYLAARNGASADGEVSLLKKGKVKVREGGLANGGLTVESVAIGLPSGSEGAVAGALLIDDFTSSP